jgi:hypothetical protein
MTMKELAYLTQVRNDKYYIFNRTLRGPKFSSCTFQMAHTHAWSNSKNISIRRYQTFWEVVGLEGGPLSLVSTTEELLGRNSGSSDLENREYSHVDPLRWPRDTLYPQKLALTSSTSGGRPVCIVRLLTMATEFVLFVVGDECYKATVHLLLPLNFN